MTILSFILFLNYLFILLYNIVLVLSYTDLNLKWLHFLSTRKCKIQKSTWQLPDLHISSQLSLLCFLRFYFSSVQSLSRVRLFVTPWTAERQASLSITNSQSLPKLMSIESVMPSNHLILCHPLLLLPSIFPSISVFSNESVLHTRWPKYWSFSSNISPSNEHSGLISFLIS